MAFYSFTKSYEDTLNFSFLALLVGKKSFMIDTSAPFLFTSIIKKLSISQIKGNHIINLFYISNKIILKNLSK